MGNLQNITTIENKNLIVLGIDQLVQLDYLDTSWVKDDINSSFDFNIFIKYDCVPNVILWCPQPTPILKKVIESLVQTIYFEGIILTIKQHENLSWYRLLIHQIMNEESMRHMAIFILILVDRGDNQIIDQEGLNVRFTEELKLTQLDSRQPRQIFIIDPSDKKSQQSELEQKSKSKTSNIITKGSQSNTNQNINNFSDIILQLISIAAKIQARQG